MVSSSLHIDGYQIATKRNSWVSKLNYGNNVAPDYIERTMSYLKTTNT